MCIRDRPELRHRQQRQADRGHREPRAVGPVRPCAEPADRQEDPRADQHVPGQRRYPGHLVGLAPAEQDQWQRPRHRARTVRRPAQPHAPPGPHPPQGHRVRGQDQQRQPVQQGAHQHGGPVRRPAWPDPPPGSASAEAPHPVPDPVPAREERHQQQGRQPGPRRDERVGPALLQVELHSRQESESQPAAEPRPGPGQAPPDEGHARGGGRDRQHRRQAQGGGARPEDLEEAVHQEVVEAVHGVDVSEHVPDVARRPPGHLPGRRLVPPHAVVPGQPPQTERQGPQEGDEPDEMPASGRGYVAKHEGAGFLGLAFGRKAPVYGRHGGFPDRLLCTTERDRRPCRP